jgi:hypothetical protein
LVLKKGTLVTGHNVVTGCVKLQHQDCLLLTGFGTHFFSISVLRNALFSSFLCLLHIFTAAVLVTIFTSIEDGLYTLIIASLVLLFIRIEFPRGVFLGKVIFRGNSSDGKATREVFAAVCRFVRKVLPTQRSISHLHRPVSLASSTNLRRASYPN